MDYKNLKTGDATKVIICLVLASLVYKVSNSIISASADKSDVISIIIGIISILFFYVGYDLVIKKIRK